MLSILICHSYFLRFDQKQRDRAKPYPPLATLQVATMLRRAGHVVSMFDAMFAEDLDDYHAAIRATRPQLVLLYEDNFNFLSKMCLGNMRRAACEMIAGARGVGARVLAAGSDVSDAPEAYLWAGADVALAGEGLGALRALLDRLDVDPAAPRCELIRGLSGVSALIDDRMVRAHRAIEPRMAAHDDPPAWDLVDIDRYRAVWLQAHGYFSLNMAASRGCSFRCAWCSKPIWGNRYQQRSAVVVASEITYLRQTFGIDHVWFADDIFGFRSDWVEEFAREMRAAGSTVPFTIQTRADLASEPMARALQDAGCKEVWIGAESGSQKVLDAMNKGTTVAEILTARARFGAAGIRVGFFIQLGYLGEHLVDIEATRELIDEARPDDVGVSVAYPLPGTKFFELVREQLGRKTHWEDSGDLAMMFQGTYTSEFYRLVRNLLHDQVTIESLNRSCRSTEYWSARQNWQRRWDDLTNNEREFRTSPALPAAATT
jgi:anaerobic magnesium-protoporphyrin IX monomethyl ester cyclase